MIARVPVASNIDEDDIFELASPKQREQLKKLSVRLQGKRVVHLNATAQGGGVAELLRSFIPYSNALGMESEWYAIQVPKSKQEFFVICDKIRNGLQGQSVHIDAAEWSLYASVNEQIALDLEPLHYDLLVVHDWQPVFAGFYLYEDIRKIFVSHADTSSAYKPVSDGIMQAVKAYDALVFSNKDFVYPDFQGQKHVTIIPPAIDPLALKQTIVPQDKARAYLSRFGIPEGVQLVVQVSRFDHWKNPRGVVDAFRQVQEKYPSCHLALVGIEEAQDNPAAQEVYQEIQELVGNTPSISLFFSSQGISNIAEFTMMAQNGADIIVQNSVKEGFGLTVTEAMWKEKPVIGGPASGIRRQITNGKNGYIVHDTEELAKRILDLIVHPKKGEKVRRAAKESVRKNFLMSRYVLDFMKVFSKSIS